MIKYSLSRNEANDIVNIFYNKEISLEERVKQISNIMSYEDFMSFFDAYADLGTAIEVSESDKCLLHSVYTIYSFIELGDFFKKYTNNNKRLVLENK